MDALKELLTTDQAAEALGLTPSRIRQMAIAGNISGVKLAYSWFFTQAEIERIRNRPKSKGGRPKKAQAQP